MPLKTKKLSELQVLSHGNLKDPFKNMVTIKNEPVHIANISQMKLISSNAGSKASSIIHSKPNSSRRMNRNESPVANQKTLIGAVLQQPKTRDKISVYPTQKVQTMKTTGADPVIGQIRKPQGSMYASSEIYIGSDRPTFLKQSTDKNNLSVPRKTQSKGAHGISAASNKHFEKMSSQGTFSIRGDQHQKTKTVKSDRANSAQLKVPGSSINIRVEPITQNEYVNPTGEPLRIKQEIVPSIQNRGQPKLLTKGATSSPYIHSQMQKKRGSAATTMKSYRPNSLTDSARGSSMNSGTGIYAKMMRGTPAHTTMAHSNTATTKPRQPTSSSSSARATYTARNKQLSSQQIRSGICRPESIGSGKERSSQQGRTKSGSLGSGSLLSPSVLNNNQHGSMPSQKIIGNRAIDQKPAVITVSNTQNRTNSGRGNSGLVSGSLKKGSVRTVGMSGLGSSTRVAQASFGQPGGKRASKKQTIFSVNTSEQR